MESQLKPGSLLELLLAKQNLWHLVWHLKSPQVLRSDQVCPRHWHWQQQMPSQRTPVLKQRALRWFSAASRVGRTINSQHDLAGDFTGFHHAMGFTGLGNRELHVNNWLN